MTVNVKDTWNRFIEDAWNTFHKMIEKLQELNQFWSEWTLIWLKLPKNLQTQEEEIKIWMKKKDNLGKETWEMMTMMREKAMLRVFDLRKSLFGFIKIYSNGKVKIYWI